MRWYFQALKKYAVFSGRARRMEYWIFQLGNMLIATLLSVGEAAVRLSMGGMKVEPGSAPVLIVVNVFTLLIIIPTLAVTIRRLHDTGRSGWWILICFIPLIGALVLLVFMVLDSEPGPNRYGPNPKG